MSLLMDALRKAEKAKQAEEEAQQRKAPEATPLEDPLSLSPVEESAEEVHRKSQSPEERPGDLTLEGISEQASAPGDAASSLALEDIDEFAELPKEQPQDNQRSQGRCAPGHDAGTTRKLRPEVVPTARQYEH